jgi:hypothetical protein
MDKIILLFLLFTMYLLTKKEPKELFVTFFLPILTVMPVYYDTKIIPGIPEMSFWSAVLLPIAFAWIMNDHAEGYRFSVADILVLAHLVIVFTGQWHNSTYKEAQKVLYNDLTIRLLPFIMIRAWFMDPESRIKMFRVMILAGAVVAVFQTIELRLWINVFDEPIRKFWPKSVAWSGGMKRGGWKRASGPFGHPICAGYYYTMFVPLAVWLWKNDYFKTRKYGFRITLLCIIGGITSISRAPIIGIFLGLILIWYGWSKYKGLATILLSCIGIMAGIFIIPKAIAYINVDRATAVTEDQRNAAYRNELMDNYKEVIEEKPMLGWGRFTVPVVKGQDSVDNEYLWMVLVSGKAALYAYLAGICWVLARVFFFAIRGDPTRKEVQLAWCMIASILTALFTQATVYSGTQTVQFFYIILGISEGIAQYGPWETTHASYPRNLGEGDYGYHFSRTI